MAGLMSTTQTAAAAPPPLPPLLNDVEMEGSSSEVGLTLEDLKEKMANFAKERDWDQFHSPRNLLLALVGEVGELSEIFQWKGEVPRGLPGWEEQEKLHLGEELSDVLLYLVRLADICGIDLSKAVLRKLHLNAIKYPINLCKGSSQKHNQIRTSYRAAAKAATTTATATTAASHVDAANSTNGNTTGNGNENGGV